MAGKGKFVSSDIWEDDWFVSLNNQEKLVFLYLLTSKARVMSGIITAPISSIMDAINTSEAKKEQRRIIEYIIEHEEKPKGIPEGFVYYKQSDVEKILNKFEKNEKIIVLKDSKYLLVNYYKHQDFDNQSMLQGVLRDIIALAKSYGSFFTNKLESNKSFYNSLFYKVEIMIRDKAIPREKMIDQDKRLVEEMVNLIRLIPGMFKDTKVLNLCLKYLLKNKLASNEDIKELINLTNNTQSTHPVDTVYPPQGQPVHNRIELNKTKTNQNKLNRTKLNNSLSSNLSLGTSVENQERGNSSKPDSSKILSLGGQDFLESSVEDEKPTLKERLIQEGIIEEDPSNPKVVAKIITGYFKKAFKRFEISLVPVVSVNIIEKAMKDYDNIADLENDARNVIEYLMTTEKIREVQDVKELPALLKWYRSKIAPKMNDKVKKV